MLGNDIVDLGHPETRAGSLSPRFDLRVFTPAERELVSHQGMPGGVSGRVWRWRLWSAKEAAYKSARKLDPAAVWSPVRFSVRLEAERVIVDHPTGRVEVSWVEGPVAAGDPAWVHALCGVGDDSTVVGVGNVDGRRESDAVRELACHAVSARAKRVGLDATIAAVHTRERIPEMQLASTIHDLSLSHHGRFAAFACNLRPMAERLREVAA